MRQKVFVVEGEHDRSRLLQIDSSLHIVITNGSEISNETIAMLQKLDETSDLVLFLDPDHAGERIRSVLDQKLNNCLHVFLAQEKAKSKNNKKIGIEHATTDDIKEAIASMRANITNSKSDVSTTKLYALGLIGKENSKTKRAIIAKRLYLGYPNGKTLLNRLHLFGIKEADLIEALNESSS